MKDDSLLIIGALAIGAYFLYSKLGKPLADAVGAATDPFMTIGGAGGIPVTPLDVLPPVAAYDAFNYFLKIDWGDLFKGKQRHDPKQKATPVTKVDAQFAVVQQKALVTNSGVPKSLLGPSPTIPGVKGIIKTQSQKATAIKLTSPTLGPFTKVGNKVTVISPLTKKFM
jgi:hypothetical protein